MKTTKKVVSVFLLGACVSGCAHHPPKLSPPETTSYAGTKAEFRDLTRLQDPCDVNGTQVASELESVNALMGHFLEVTDPKRADWTQAEVDEAKRAKDLMTPAVDAADNDIQVLSSRCPYLDPALRLQDAQKRGRDLIQPTRDRLRTLPAVVDAHDYGSKLAKWKEDQVKAVQTAHDNWCPPKLNPRKMPDIYYAAQDENGRTSWLFCDGGKVLTSEGGAPQFIAGPGRRHHPERAYLSAANSFPPDEIKHPPARQGSPSSMPDSTPKPLPESAQPVAQ